MAKKRRLDKDLIDFFNSVNLEKKHRQFIDGCLECQNKYPQLSVRQWRTVTYLINVYLAKALNNDIGSSEDKVKVETEVNITKTYKLGKKERTTTIDFIPDK